MRKRYTFVSKASGKPAKIRGAHTRASARAIKRTVNREVAIFDNILGRIVR